MGLSVPKSNRTSGSTRSRLVPPPPPRRPRRPARAYSPLRPRDSSQRPGVAEAADQVGHGVAILAHRDARQLDPRRTEGIAGLRGLRVERLIDIGGDPIGILAHALPRRILGHRLGDDPRQALHRALADQRTRIMIVRPFPRRPMACGALLPVDLLALLVRRGRDQQGYSTSSRRTTTAPSPRADGRGERVDGADRDDGLRAKDSSAWVGQPFTIREGLLPGSRRGIILGSNQAGLPTAGAFNPRAPAAMWGRIGRRIEPGRSRPSDRLTTDTTRPPETIEDRDILVLFVQHLLYPI